MDDFVWCHMRGEYIVKEKSRRRTEEAPFFFHVCETLANGYSLRCALFRTTEARRVTARIDNEGNVGYVHGIHNHEREARGSPLVPTTRQRFLSEVTARPSTYEI